MGYQQKKVPATITRLEELFGERSDEDNDGEKISHQWTVEFQGHDFFVYNWKDTSLYDPEFMSPDVFDSVYREIPYVWNVGSKADAPVDAFIQHILGEETQVMPKTDYSLVKVEMIVSVENEETLEQLKNIGSEFGTQVKARHITCL